MGLALATWTFRRPPAGLAVLHPVAAIFCHILWWLEKNEPQVLPKVRYKFIFLFRKSSVLLCSRNLYPKSRKRGKLTKSKKAKVDEFVTITIRSGFLFCGDFKPVRGMQVPSPKSQETYLSRGNQLGEGLKKRSSYARFFGNDEAYKLCFQDGSEVNTLPGIEEPFTLEKDKEDLGKTYTRITLFLWPLEDASDTHKP